MQDAAAVPLNRISFPGKIHLITNDYELDVACNHLEQVTELGFDTETKPSFKKGHVFKVALLQLATESDAYLIRLHHVTHYHHIKKILENTKILKVGAAIRDDLKVLQKVFTFVPGNFHELQNLAKEKNLKNFGLRGMTEEVLNAALSKGPKMTNWELKTLTAQQQMYAATDAWIGLALYKKLKEIPI